MNRSKGIFITLCWVTLTFFCLRFHSQYSHNYQLKSNLNKIGFLSDDGLTNTEVAASNYCPNSGSSSTKESKPAVDYTELKRVSEFLISFGASLYIIQDINRCKHVALVIFPFHSFW